MNPTTPLVLARGAALLAAQRQPLLALLASSHHLALGAPSPPARALRPYAAAAAASATAEEPYDVVIVGAGMVGAAVAALLRAGGDPLTAALRVALVDRAPPPAALPASLSGPPDSRVSTLTPASLAALARCGAWEGRLRPLSAEFRHMQVWDALGKGYVRWSAPAAAARGGGGGGGATRGGSNAEQAPAPPIMGAVAENALLQAALLEAALAKGSEGGGCLDILAPAAVEALELPAYSPHERPLAAAARAAAGAAPASSTDRLAELRLSSSPGATREVRARLVVGADGARSRVRELAGIRAPEWPAYGQRAIVATVEVAWPPGRGDGGGGGGGGAPGLDKSSNNDTAWQVFLPEGPLALLPVRGTSLANVVWSTTPRRAAELEALGPGGAFAAAVDAALRRGGGQGGGRGAGVTAGSALAGAAAAVGAGLAAATSLASAAFGLGRDESGGSSSGGGGGGGGAAQQWRDPPRVVGMPPGAQAPRSFPLVARHAGRYVRPRLALVGDAAHSVHPLAGQGVNLGLADADALARALARRLACGGDVGSGAFLAREYEGPRRLANGRMMAALDGLQRLFALGGPAGAVRFGGQRRGTADDGGDGSRAGLLLGAVRGAGLAGLNAFPQLRDAFVLEYAMASGGG
jgi:ubiquinone biosynthesis monooxygenase Coq6